MTLKFYSDSPGLAFDTESGKWLRVDDQNETLGIVNDYESDTKKQVDLAFYDGEDQMEPFFDHFEYKTNKVGTVKRFNSGFKMFDEKLGGLELGEVVVISGKKKNGKTLFAESWLRSIVQNDSEAKLMFLSYEVQTQKLLMKYLDNPSFPLFVPRSLKTMDFEWLKDRCLEAKLKFKVNILLLDHLHFMIDMSTKQNMSLNIGAFMRRLKQDIAIGLNMAVVLIAHQGQLRGDQSASADTLRDSSFISQESDSIIIISRKKNFDPSELNKLEQKNPSKYELYCQKVMGIGEEKEMDDPYSLGLALVSIDCARRTGTYEFKKVFQKNGEFLEEL